jgi:hypothetical protein
MVDHQNQLNLDSIQEIDTFLLSDNLSETEFNEKLNIIQG